MRIAVMADVHGNLAALESVLADISSQNIDLVVNLGDCVSGPLWPAETLELMQKSDWVHVRGNHDRYVGGPTTASTGPSDRFAIESLNEKQRAWLLDRPTSTSPVSGILCFHGSPTSDEEYLLEEVVAKRLVLRSPEMLSRSLENYKDIVVLCGHSHMARHVRNNGNVDVINPGSVGLQAYEDPDSNPHFVENGSPHARYAILEQVQGALKAEFRNIEYDWKPASRKAEKEGRMDWKVALETGYVETRADYGR